MPIYFSILNLNNKIKNKSLITSNFSELDSMF